MNRNIWVYDIETFKRVFTYCAINIDTKEIVKFILHEEKNELLELINHLKSGIKQVGFNNIDFDYPIIHFILENYSKWIGNDLDVNIIISCIYGEAQRIINHQNKKTFGFDKIPSGIKEKYWKIPQLDLYKMWHFNNSVRATSLKALEISMNYPNVMESSIHHTSEELSLEQVDKVLEYNLNDVMATLMFYELSKEKIQLRIDLNKKYNINCINYPDSKIGEELVLKSYCLQTEQDYWDVKKQQTIRDFIALRDCIFDYISFESKEFKKLLEDFKSTIVTETKGSIEKSVIYKGFKYVYGLGGIHGSIKEGVYENSSDYVILDADVECSVLTH